MNHQVKKGATSAFASLLALAGPVLASEHRIATAEIEEYFQSIQQEFNQIVQTGEYQRVVVWTQENVAEEAHLQGSFAIIHDGASKFAATVMLEKPDLLRGQGLLTAGLQADDPIEDYSLQIEVQDIVPHGEDAATVRVTWSDSGTLQPSRDQAAPEAPAVTFERHIDCRHLLQRNGDRMMIGLSNCIGEARL